MSLLIIILLLIISGCSNKKVINYNYTFKGENSFWTVEYNVNGKGTPTEKDEKISYEGNASEKLTVTYKKSLSELSSAKHLLISYKSGSSEGNISQYSPREKTYTLEPNSSGGITEIDKIIKVNINIDGKPQIIELKKVQ